MYEKSSPSSCCAAAYCSSSAVPSLRAIPSTWIISCWGTPALCQGPVSRSRGRLPHDRVYAGICGAQFTRLLFSFRSAGNNNRRESDEQWSSRNAHFCHLVVSTGRLVHSGAGLVWGRELFQHMQNWKRPEIKLECWLGFGCCTTKRKRVAAVQSRERIAET